MVRLARTGLDNIKGVYIEPVNKYSGKLQKIEEIENIDFIN